MNRLISLVVISICIVGCIASSAYGQVFSGHVYEGPPGRERTPLSGVTVQLYVSNTHGALGSFASGTTTDGNGWYGLGIPVGYEYFSIVEQDPEGHTSVDATSPDGEVLSYNWIQYAYPLTSKNLGDNDFYDIPLNRAPSAQDDVYSVQENQTLTVRAPGVLGNDMDPDGDFLTAVLAAAAIHGTVILQEDGSFQYTPEAGYRGSDVFTYEARDEHGATSTGIVTVDVMPDGVTPPPLRRTFGGTVYQVDRPGHNTPLRGVQVSLHESGGERRERLLATDHTDPDGRFTFAVFVDPAYDPAYYIVSADDPAYTPVSIVPGPGGEVIEGRGSRFHKPGPGDHGDTLFGLKWVGPLLLQKEPPATVAFANLACLPPQILPSNPPVTDVSILGIEVTQAIQCFDQAKGYTNCLDNSLELTMGKPTVVRVYIGHQGGPASDGNEPVIKYACVKLTWAAIDQNMPPGMAWLGSTMTTSFNVPCTTKLDKMRESPSGSANFYLQPGALGPSMKDKFLWVQAEVTVAGLAESNTGNNVTEVSVPVTWRKPLTVTGLLVYYNPYEPIVPISNPIANIGVVGNAGEFMKKIFPMPVSYALLSTNVFLIYGDNPWTAQKEQTYHKEVYLDQGLDLLTLLYKFRTSMTPQPDVLVGWLPVPPGNVVPNIWGANSWGEPIAWLFQRKSDTATAETLAHEVAHTQGIKHVVTDKYGMADTCAPDTKILETGFDVDVMSPISADTVDLMKDYCGFWISPYVWNRLLGKAPAPGWSVCSSAASSPGEAVMWVSGQVHANGTVDLDTPYIVQVQDPIPASAASGEYFLDLRNSSGSPLVTRRFDLSFRAPETGASVDASSFCVGLPYDAEATRLVLRRGATVLMERRASAHAPELKINRPGGGERITGGMTAAWTASDLDGDSLGFRVFYSPDGGVSWRPSVLDTTATSLSIDTGGLPGGDNARVRVLASDGFHTTAVDSAPFRVAQKAPNASISAPVDGVSHPVLHALTLSGWASDLEDGELTGGSLVWTSHRQGTLGSGPRIILPGRTLDAGEHRITLTATDSAGQSRAHTVTIFISEE